VSLSTGRRRVAATAVAAVAVFALGWSAWKDVPHSWRLLRTQHDAYAGYTRAERDRAFGVSIPMPMVIFDYWRNYLRPWDRYYIQIPHEAFSSNGDKKYVARLISHVYLLPAIETTDPKKATVVLSWDADPGTLPLQYSVKFQSGRQPIFVARVANVS
jgi:hypothetical protein